MTELPDDPPDFSLGIEEEYLTVDARTMDLAAVPDSMLAAAHERLHDQVSPEFRDCMIEVGTRVCPDIAAAREDLRLLRNTLAEIADDHGLAVFAVPCHPFGDPESRATGPEQRYANIAHDIGGLSRQLMTCGMHVHVGIGDSPAANDLRIDLMRQFRHFLPLVLALSASSPFWRGRDTELASWRLSIFDAIPRSRVPPDFGSWADYRHALGLLTGAGTIEGAGSIWWDMRPSESFPTLEVRIADVMPRLEQALSVAAFIQATLRMLWRLNRNHMRWRDEEHVLMEENRWRAQRYGTEATLIDSATGRLVPMTGMLEQALDLMTADATVLDCTSELRGTLDIARTGGSAARQRETVQQALDFGADRPEALRELMRGLAAEFRAGL